VSDLIVVDSVLNPNIKTILVKGEPGTGKTMLASELVRTQGKGIYISVTTSNRDAVAYNPILKDLISKGKLVQISYGTEKDSKIDNPSFNSLDALLESVATAAGKLGGSLIVFDSWDAMLLETIRKSSSSSSSSSSARTTSLERTKIQRSLLEIAEASGCKLLFLSEERELKTEDYLFDSIVILRRDIVSGRLFRRLEISKLSGSPISKRTYLFSLNEGRFTVMDKPQIPSPHRFDVRFFIPRKHGKASFSTGSADLDNFFNGGMKFGSSIFIEFGGHLQTELTLPLFSSIECNFLASAGSCVVIPPSDVLPEMIVDHVNPYVPPSISESSFRIGSYELRDNPSFFPLDPNSLSKTREIFWEQADALKGAERKPCFWFVGLDTLEALYGLEGILRFSVMTIQRVKYYEDIVFIVSKESTQSKKTVAGVCDSHLKLQEVDGALAIYSIKPKSEPSCIEYNHSSGFPQVKLIPIV
jgi:KaiC/GvpD/RAD55 family RecA-like ATPase